MASLPERLTGFGATLQDLASSIYALSFGTAAALVELRVSPIEGATRLKNLAESARKIPPVFDALALDVLNWVKDVQRERELAGRELRRAAQTKSGGGPHGNDTEHQG